MYMQKYIEIQACHDVLEEGLEGQHLADKRDLLNWTGANKAVWGQNEKASTGKDTGRPEWRQWLAGADETKWYLSKKTNMG